MVCCGLATEWVCAELSSLLVHTHTLGNEWLTPLACPLFCDSMKIRPHSCVPVHAVTPVDFQQCHLICFFSCLIEYFFGLMVGFWFDQTQYHYPLASWSDLVMFVMGFFCLQFSKTSFSNFICTSRCHMFLVRAWHVETLSGVFPQ